MRNRVSELPSDAEGSASASEGMDAQAEQMKGFGGELVVGIGMVWFRWRGLIM